MQWRKTICCNALFPPIFQPTSCPRTTALCKGTHEILLPCTWSLRSGKPTFQPVTVRVCVCLCPMFDTLGPALATATDTWLFASYGELFRSATIYYSCRKCAASFPFDHQFEFTQRLQFSRYVPCHCMFHRHTHAHTHTHSPPGRQIFASHANACWWWPVFITMLEFVMKMLIYPQTKNII